MAAAVVDTAAAATTDPDFDDGPERIDVRAALARVFSLPDKFEVRVGDLLVAPEDLSAERWMWVLVRRDSIKLLDLVDEATSTELRRASMLGRLSEQQRVEAYRDLLAAVTGRTWYQAENLATQILGVWRDLIGPKLTTAGMDALDLSISQLLDFGYHTLVSSLKEEEWRRIELAMNTPPADPDVSDPDDLVMDEAAFRRAATRM